MIKSSALAGAALLLAVAGGAAAGCCPTCRCAPVVVQKVLVPVEPMYVVNQGPVYSGPGHYLNGFGPFVGAIPGPGYPYNGGYPRGSYRAFTGYPLR